MILIGEKLDISNAMSFAALQWTKKISLHAWEWDQMPLITLNYIIMLACFLILWAEFPEQNKHYSMIVWWKLNFQLSITKCLFQSVYIIQCSTKQKKNVLTHKNRKYHIKLENYIF